MQDLLENSRAERDQVSAARELLVAKLSDVESALIQMGAARLKLEGSVALLSEELDGSKDARQALTDEKARLTGRVAGLEQNLGATQAEREMLKQHIAGLDVSLLTASGQTARVEEQRDLLELRVGGLEQQIVDLRDAGVGVIERLSERTQLSVEVIEKTVAMTGLDVESLIAQVDHSHLGQGGPFVPAGSDVASFAPSTQLGNTVNLLEDKLNRWSALRVLLASLPLTSPLDQYRISSGYGSRKDPVNGLKAQHRAVDFAAPTGASIYSTAPGKIVFAGWRGRYGRTIEIDHGHGIRTRYAHLRKILVKVGDEVDHRQKIGLVGSSGRSTGPHVHYEVRYKNKARNPMKFLKAGRYVFKG
jgi:murein DD-endopeptidase MepM/ murein hydrolase activator NlpD